MSIQVELFHVFFVGNDVDDDNVRQFTFQFRKISFYCTPIMQVKYFINFCLVLPYHNLLVLCVFEFLQAQVSMYQHNDQTHT